MAIPPTIAVPAAAAAVAAAASAQAAATALKPGDVLTALVLQTLADGTARLAVGEALLDVASQVPLAPGSTVRLAVQSTTAGLTLALLDSDGGQAPQGTAAPARATTAATVDKATALASVAAAQPGADAAAKSTVAVLAQAVRGAAARQDGLAPLFADAAEVAQAETLPKAVRQAIAQLLALRTPTAAPITADAIRQAMSRSGLFLEARLAAASPAKTPLPGAPDLTAPQAPPADLKAALLALRQVLKAWVGEMPATTAQTGGPTAQPPGRAPATEIPQDASAPSASRPADSAARTAKFLADLGMAEEGSSRPGLPAATVARTAAVADRVLPPRPAASPSGLGDAVRASTTPLGGTQSVDKMPAPEAGRMLSVPTRSGGSVAPAALLAMLEQSVRSGLPEDVPYGRLPDSGQPENGGEGRVRGSSPTASGLPASRLVDLLERSLALPDAPSRETNAKAPPTPAMEDAARRAKAAPEPSAPPSPPYRGGPTAAQPAAAAAIAADAEPRAIGERLLGETDAALARHTLLQAASLADGAGLDQPDRTAPRWAFEIPLATLQGTAVAQFEIARDGRNAASSTEAKPAWRARFTLDVEPIGPVHVQIALSGARAGVTLWAERQESAARLRADAPLLADALREVELEPGDVLVRDGEPPRSAAASAGHFWDRAS